MADNRKQYEVTIGGLPHTLLLDADDAERHEAAGHELKEVRAARNKAGRTPTNKAG